MVFCGLYPGRQRRVPGPSGSPGEVAAERREPRLRSRELDSARLWLSLRLSWPPPYGDRPGAARAGVWHRPDHDGAQRRLPGDPDGRRRRDDRQPFKISRALQIIAKVEEPFVLANIMVPESYVGAVMELCQDRRGTFKNMEYLTPSEASDRVRIAARGDPPRLLRQAQVEDQRVRLARLRTDRISRDQPGQDGHLAERRTGGRPLLHRRTATRRTSGAAS